MPVLQETGEFNRQTEEILAAITFIENQLRESLTGEISVLCSGYIVTRCFAAVFSNSLRELEALETGLPISLLPKVEEIRQIASSIGEKVEELNDTVKEIQTKLKEFKRQKLEITEEDKKELDMLVIEFEGHIDEAEVFLKGGEEAMKSFEDGVSSCNWQDAAQRVGSVMASTAAGAVAGALFGGAVNAAAKGAGMVGKAGKFMLDMGVTTKTAAVGGAVLTGTQSFNEQLTLFLPLFFGASVAGLCLFFALNYWFPKNELYNKLALVIRNYSNMVHRSRDIKLQIKCTSSKKCT
ncbi:uncharacterized protein [Porites lutea]|uniref:uncharacterized protein n=1 Tax=Porites lutea TaxID=51062 RepID=UPI003CC627EC